MKKVIIGVLMLGAFMCGVSGCNDNSRGRGDDASNDSVAGRTAKSNGDETEKKKGGETHGPRTEVEGELGEAERNRQQTNDLRPIPSIKTGVKGSAAHGEMKKPRDLQGNDNQHLPSTFVITGEGARGVGEWEEVAWSNANGCEVKKDARNGNALELHCQEGPNSKAAICYELQSPLNSIPYDVIRGKVELVEQAPEADGAKFAVGLETDTYYEAESKKLSSGDTGTFTVDLASKSYKTSPEWKYSSGLQARDKVRRIYLLFYYAGRCRVKLKSLSFHRLTEETGAQGAP